MSERNYLPDFPVTMTNILLKNLKGETIFFHTNYLVSCSLLISQFKDFVRSFFYRYFFRRSCDRQVALSNISYSRKAISEYFEKFVWLSQAMIFFFLFLNANYTTLLYTHSGESTLKLTNTKFQDHSFRRGSCCNFLMIDFFNKIDVSCY